MHFFLPYLIKPRVSILVRYSGYLFIFMTSLFSIGCDINSQESFLSSLSEADSVAIDTVTSNIVAGGKKVLLAGDSRVEYFPIEKLNATVFNCGKSGSTSLGCLNKLPGYVAYDVDFFILSVGINDITVNKLYRGYSDPVNDLLAIIDGYTQAKPATKMILTSVPYVGIGFEDSVMVNGQCDILNSFIQRMCNEKNIIFYDLNQTLSVGDFLAPEYDDGSHIHFNAAGYDKIIAEYTSIIYSSN